MFFPQAALDEWIAEDTIDLNAEELVIRAEARRYRIVEAVRILSEVAGGLDENQLVGKVKSQQYLADIGAEVLDTSLIVGENAYEVVPGFLGSPVGSFAEHLTGPARAEARAGSGEPASKSSPNSDEDLLAHFLISNLD